MKQVKIDDRTMIEVDDNIPDEVAKRTYLERLAKPPESVWFQKGQKKKIKHK